MTAEVPVIGEPHRHAGLAFLVALVAAMLQTGCRSVPPPPEKPTAGQLWDKAVAALAAADVPGAADLFARSLAAADDPARRADAAVRLAAAGRPDLAAGLLAERNEPDLAHLARAIEAFGRQPPPGKADNPYVVAEMAEALGVVAEPVELLPTSPPMKFSAAQLGQLARTWQKWRYFGALLASGVTRPTGEPRRATPVWLIEQGRALFSDPGHYIVQSARPAGLAGTLAHVGSWPLAADGDIYDAVALVRRAVRGPARLYLSSRTGRQRRRRFVLAGELTGDGMVVTACSAPPTLGRLVDAIADATGGPDRFTPRTRAERAVAIRLAALLDRAGQLGPEGRSLVVIAADTAGTDFADEPRWLADVARYVRYGQHLADNGAEIHGRQ